MNKVYFDHAATTRMYPEVIEVMVDAMNKSFGNPSSTHVFGRQSRGLIENVRKSIAQHCGVTSAEIIFTSCGTEANNLILRSCAAHLDIEHIVTSPLEHKCVSETIQEISKCYDLDVTYLKPNAQAELSLDELENTLKSLEGKKVLVSLMHANNEVGNLYDLEAIGNLCKTYGAFFHSDMVQTLGHYPLNLQEIPVDFASSSAHKYHGPKGAGFAYIRKGTGLKAQITGGGQERNLRSGTENVHGIVGMGKAFEISLEKYQQHKAHVLALKKYAIQAFQATFPEVKFNGKSADLEHSLYTLLSVLLPFKDSMIGFELDLKGIGISQGSACSSGAVSLSNVMQQLLNSEQQTTGTPIRVSFAAENTTQEIDYLVQTLKSIHQKQIEREQRIAH